jgi:hypothetical protein
MSALQQMLRTMSMVCFTSLGACSSASPVTAKDIQHYTGIELCPAAAVHDLTSKEERDTTPGFSFHVTLGVPSDCVASFERQLAKLSPSECSPERVLGPGCFVRDAYPTAGKHTSIMVHRLGDNRFDLRFYS